MEADKGIQTHRYADTLTHTHTHTYALTWAHRHTDTEAHRHGHTDPKPRNPLSRTHTTHNTHARALTNTGVQSLS